MKKKLSLFMALLLVLSTLVACTTDPGETPPTESQTEETPAPVETPTPEPEPEPEPEPQVLVAGYSFFSQKFSPFFSKTAYDQDAAAITQLALIGNDRAGDLILNGIKGETKSYNGTDYFYDGPADIEVVRNSDGSVDYNITLRDDLVFSDGVPITIDDVIFNMYVLSDPSYDGSSTFYSLPVIGMGNFRSGVSDEIYVKYDELGNAIFAAGPDNTDFSNWTEEQQATFWGECLQRAGIKFTQEIIDYCLNNYASYLSAVNQDEVALGMYVWGFGEPDDDGIFTTAVTETVYDLPAGQTPTVEDYWNEILTAYGMDFSAEGLNVESAGTPIEAFMIEAFIAVEGPKDPEAGGEIMSIEGIKRTGDYTMTVTTEKFEVTSIYQLGISITPLHYYGDASLYDYDNNKFGFTKGDLTIVKSKTTEPAGAGPYRFLTYENGVISYEANENYYKGEPKIKYLRFQETTDGDKLTGVRSGSFDVTDPSFSNDAVASIKEYNSNGELSGDVITTSTVDNLGYGYLGICANTVNVGGVPDSQESRNLRIAIATVLAVYRDTANNSYYGDRAATIQYPISNTSWAAPRPNDEGYKIAYSVDVDGNNIYTDAMTEAERATAALDAAVGYLKAAGFTWDEGSGTFTAAPAGAKLTYEFIIPADGVGDHPAYSILTAAKEAFASIGIAFEINDPADSNELWTALESGVAELWSAAWGATIDPDMYQVYHSSNIVGEGGTDSNHYAIADAELDELIIEARQSDDQVYRKNTYKRCLEIILEWGVEVPNYQRQNAIIFSSERVNISTITPDITTFWGWMNDIELIEMN